MIKIEEAENHNYASSAFSGKIVKIVLIMANYAKNCAVTIYQSPVQVNRLMKLRGQVREWTKILQPEIIAWYI